MKPFALIALFVAGVAANGNGWGAPAAPQVRVQTPSYGSSSSNSYGSSYGSSSSSNSYSGGYGSSSSTRNEIPITSYNHDITGSQSSSLSYQTGNGITLSDNTRVVAGRGGMYDAGNGNMVQSDSVLTKSGAYSYTSPEGKPISLSWTADEHGFRAQGDHLPVPVPMPADHAEAHRQAQMSQSQYSQPQYSQSQYSQAQPQYSQSQPQYSQSQPQYSQPQHQYSQSNSYGSSSGY